MPMLRIIGLDLSGSRCGWAVSDHKGELLEFGSFNLSGFLDEKLLQLRREIEDLIFVQTKDPTDNLLVSIERPRGWSADVLFVLGRLNGVVRLTLNRYGSIKDVFEYPPEAGKIALAGKGNAKKEEMIAAFKERYPEWIRFQRTPPVQFSKGMGKNKEIWTDLSSDEADAYGMCLAVLSGRKAAHIRSKGGPDVFSIEQYTTLYPEVL